MEERDKSLLELEKKIDNYNEKEHILKDMRINKPNMNMNNLNNKFNKNDLLSFLNNFKKENEKIMNEPDKMKYNIEYEQEDNEEEDGDDDDEQDENEDEDDDNDSDDRKIKKNKKEKIELDLLMGILEQQKKKEITINDIIENKKKENEKKDNLEQLKDIQGGEKEIIDFLKEKKQ